MLRGHATVSGRGGGVGDRRRPSTDVLADLPPAVRRMWLLERLDPGPGLHVQCSLRIIGALDPGVVRRALHEIARRHDALRSRFPTVDGRVRVVTDPSVVIPLAVVPLVAGSDDAEERLRRMAVAEARRRFDLEAGPLVRCLLVRIGAVEHHLLLLCHHTIADRRASDRLARELIDLLGTEGIDERAAPRTDPPTRATSRPRRRAVRPHVDLVAGWADRLAGAPISLDLPTDRPRPARSLHIGRSARAAVDRHTFDALGTLARTAGTTRFVAVLAAWAVVLHRFSGCEDLIVGTHVAATDDDGTAPVGCSMSTVPVRLDLAGDPSFHDLLVRSGDAAGRALEGAALPFDVLVDRLGVERDGNRNPCFQVDYSYWGRSAPHRSVGPLVVTGMPLDLDVALLELGLAADASPAGGLLLRVDADAGLFHPSTARSLVLRVRDVLVDAIAHPDRPASGLATLGDDERDALLQLGRGPSLDGTARPVLTLIAEHADAAPDDPAIRVGGAITSYAELVARVGAVADALAERGIGPGCVVGVSAVRPMDWVVADLAVMASGAAFAPLDPSMPERRRRTALEVAGIDLVVTSGLDPTPWGDGTTVDLTELARGCTPATGSPLRRLPAEDHPAYVVLTSGSTGAPKPVVVTVANLAASNAAHLARYAEPISGVVCIHEPVFDAWIGMVLWTLSAGGALVVPDEPQRRDPRRIGSVIHESSATHMVCLPSYWRLVLDHCPAEQLASLTTVIVGAEASPSDLVRRHHEVLGGRAALHDEYGPTETTVWCTAHQQRPDDDRPPASIGRPIAGARAYVVDDALRLVPRGMPGELLVGGAGVAAGYLGLRDLTAERFVADPFVPAGRAYRTGDRVRWLHDGTLQLLGRRDGQVKLRGRRVELGEVEAALSAHHRVHEAVAAIVPGPGGGVLAAWVTGASPDDVAQILDEVRCRVSAWMVPAHVTIVPHLPRTATGKVDRSSLVGGWSRPMDGRVAGARPDLTATEAALRGLWQRTLGLDHVGLSDDFFTLGGHSLLAVELFALIDQALGHDLPLSMLLEHPTVSRLAAAIDERRTPTWSTIVPLPLDGVVPSDDGSTDTSARRPFFCVHGAGGNVLRLREVSQHLDRDHPFHALQSPALDGRSFPFDTLGEMASAYLDAVRDVQPTGPYLLGGFSMGGVVALEMAIQAASTGQRPSAVVLIDSAPPGGPAPSVRRATPRQPAGPPPLTARRLRRLSTAALDEVRVRVGLRIPVARRPAAMLRTSRRLVGAYRPATVFEGPALLVLSNDAPDIVTWWTARVPRLEAVTVLTSHHEGLLDEPHASKLADVIQGFFDRVAWI